VLNLSENGMSTTTGQLSRYAGVRRRDLGYSPKPRTMSFRWNPIKYPGYHIPRSNPDGVDGNLRCLDTPPAEVRVVAFDGVNWEQNAAALAHKSR
jgi:hypothetical protein